jgi:tRNA pseudouridine55 synthase
VNGWIILDKPVGMGSTQAVGAVKRNLREAGFGKVKVGHGGTLDPLASGVLPIALGEATKLCGRMLDASKTYNFTIAFGTETEGLDAEGDVIATSDVRPTAAAIAAILNTFIGEIAQIPPAYSAIKVDGKRAYDRARAGEAVEMKARRVEIFDLLIRHSGLDPGSMVQPSEPKPAPEDDTRPWTLKQVQSDDIGGGASERLSAVTLAAHVSKGTYIRSLARDIAHALGTVGHVSMLRRTRAGPFTLESAISLDKLNAFGQGAPQSEILLPLEAGLVDIPALDLSPEAAGAIRQGRVWTGVATDDGLYWGRDGEMRPVALIQSEAGTLRVVRGFNL